MQLRHAKKLHNGDEILDKETGESVRVLSVSFHSDEFPGRGGAAVYIEGVGNKSGYSEWHHRRVR